MISGSKDVDSSSNDKASGSKPSTSSTTSSWLRLKDPRIVRVSRAFGGKDRHSKVCTIRGLRDRRVRLSVPTAIQLYDLQDRLGLNQPSKVVDWLLNAAKDEIDQLPPLPFPPGSALGLNNRAVMLVNSLHHQSAGNSELMNNDGVKMTNRGSLNWEDPAVHHVLTRPTCTNFEHSHARSKSKEVGRDSLDEQENHTRNEDGKGEINEGLSSLLPKSSVIPYSSFIHLEPPAGSRNYSEGRHGFAVNQTDQDHHHNANVGQLQSALSLSGSMQSYFPSLMEIDHRQQQVNSFQVVNLTTSAHLNQSPISFTPINPYNSVNQVPIKPFHFSMEPRLLHSHDGSRSNDQAEHKDPEEFPCK